MAKIIATLHKRMAFYKGKFFVPIKESFIGFDCLYYNSVNEKEQNILCAG
jgi:hypothetical protein